MRVQGRLRPSWGPSTGCGRRAWPKGWCAPICYLVEDRAAGFGFQAMAALHADAPLQGPLLYHGTELPGFHTLGQQMESHWIALLCERVGLARERLSLLCARRQLSRAPGTHGTSIVVTFLLTLR